MLKEGTYMRRELLEILFKESDLEMISDCDDTNALIIGDTKTLQVFFLIWDDNMIDVHEQKLASITDAHMEVARKLLEEKGL